LAAKRGGIQEKRPILGRGAGVVSGARIFPTFCTAVSLFEGVTGSLASDPKPDKPVGPGVVLKGSGGCSPHFPWIGGGGPIFNPRRGGAPPLKYLWRGQAFQKGGGVFWRRGPAALFDAGAPGHPAVGAP